MTQNVPLLAEVRGLMEIQKRLGGEPEYLWNCLAVAKTHHEFAAAFIALWLDLGYYPITTSDYASNPFQRASIRLAEELYWPISQMWNVKPDVSRNIKGLTTTVMDTGGYVIGLSDAARREAAALRKLEGKGEYKGARFIQPKKRSGLNGMYGTGRHQNVGGW